MPERMIIDRAETAKRLRDSLATIEWAASLVPMEWSHALPDFYAKDEWTVAMNVAHLVVYDEEVALPVLRSLAEGGDGTGATRENLRAWFEPDATALASSALSELLARLRAVRVAQADIVDAFDEALWNEPVCPLWSSV
jgi:hypothetical protein